MYFHNRAEAGRLLAAKLEKYKSENIVVLALNPGSIIVAAQIAMRLHANLLLYLVRDIYLPGENEAIAGMGSGGTYVYNNYYSAGELEDMTSEYHQHLDQQRMEKNHELHLLLGRDGEIDKKLLRHRDVILVSDGLSSGFSLNIAAQYLKMVAIKRLIVVTPVATVSAVDKMHLLSDDLVCLNVVESFMGEGTNHYYDQNVIPNVDDTLKIMRNIIINWEQ